MWSLKGIISFLSPRPFGSVESMLLLTESRCRGESLWLDIRCSGQWNIVVLLLLLLLLHALIKPNDNEMQHGTLHYLTTHQEYNATNYHFSRAVRLRAWIYAVTVVKLIVELGVWNRVITTPTYTTRVDTLDEVCRGTATIYSYIICCQKLWLLPRDYSIC